MSRITPKLLCTLGLLAVAGCGSGGLQLTPVKGTVTVDGKPLPRAGISFRADASKGNKTLHVPSATADAEGKFEVTTTIRKGAEPGWYKVVLFPPGPEEIKGDIPATTWPFAKKYSDPDTTDLTLEVKPNAPPGSYDLKLQR